MGKPGARSADCVSPGVSAETLFSSPCLHSLEFADSASQMKPEGAPLPDTAVSSLEGSVRTVPNNNSNRVKL